VPQVALLAPGMLASVLALSGAIAELGVAAG